MTVYQTDNTDYNKIKTTTFRYNDIDIPVWKKHTPNRLAWDIVNVNQKTIYTAITMLGLPGWGKTTATQNLLHDIHTIAPSFAIHWHFKEDILKVDRILERLPKRKPAILVFDDVSWLLQQLGTDDKYRILNKLTTVREILDPEFKRTNCILFMDYHYSFAVDKPFRQAPFSVQVSITNEERENYLKTIGHSPRNRKAIYTFVQILESAYKYNQFRVDAPEGFEKEFFYYKTNEPFRPSMVFNMSQIHFMIFHKVNCERCSPKKTYDKPDPAWLSQLVEKEGIDRVHRVFRFFVALQTGRTNLLHKKDQRIVRHIRDEITSGKLPLEDMEAILGEVKLMPKDQQGKALVNRLGGLGTKEIESVEKLAEHLSQSVDANDVIVPQDQIAPDDEDVTGSPAYELFSDDTPEYTQADADNDEIAKAPKKENEGEQ